MSRMEAPKQKRKGGWRLKMKSSSMLLRRRRCVSAERQLRGYGTTSRWAGTATCKYQTPLARKNLQPHLPNQRRRRESHPVKATYHHRRPLGFPQTSQLLRLPDLSFSTAHGYAMVCEGPASSGRQGAADLQQLMHLLLYVRSHTDVPR